MKRKGSLSSSASSLPTCSSAIAPPPGAKSKTYVEFHASMSLDNPASAMDFLASAASFEGAPCDRQHAQVIEELTPLEAYACDVAVLKKLQELHHLCNVLPSNQMHMCSMYRRMHPLLYQFVNWYQSLTSEISNGPQQRETHLRTLQLALLHERNLRATKKGESGPVPLPAAPSDTAPPSNEIDRPATIAMRAASNADPAALVEQLVESLETFDGDEAIDLFQLAM